MCGGAAVCVQLVCIHNVQVDSPLDGVKRKQVSGPSSKAISRWGQPEDKLVID